MPRVQGILRAPFAQPLVAAAAAGAATAAMVHEDRMDDVTRAHVRRAHLSPARHYKLLSDVKSAVERILCRTRTVTELQRVPAAVDVDGVTLSSFPASESKCAPVVGISFFNLISCLSSSDGLVGSQRDELPGEFSRDRVIFKSF